MMVLKKRWQNLLQKVPINRAGLLNIAAVDGKESVVEQ
jgi:hypothetical protein